MRDEDAAGPGGPRRAAGGGPMARLTGRLQPRKERFGLLLVLLVGSFLLFGFSGIAWVRLLAGLLELAGVVVVSMFSQAGGSRPLGSLLVVVVALATGLSSPPSRPTTLYGVGSLLNALVIVVLIGMLGRRLFRQQDVTLQTLFGATSAYMFLGMFYASLYGAIDSFSSTPFFGSPVPHSVYSYFSFTTLTTLGFGDYTAKSDVGRRIVAIEAITGQIFLATALARLVSLYRRPGGGGDGPKATAVDGVGAGSSAGSGGRAEGPSTGAG